MEDGWKKSTFTSNEAEMVDRLLYSLDLAIRRTGRVTRQELDKVPPLVNSHSYSLILLSRSST